MNEAYILATLIKTGVKVAVTNCIISSRFATGAILVPITELGNKPIETVLVSNVAQMERSAFRPIPEGAVRLIAYNDFSGFKHVFTKDVPESKLFDYLADVVAADDSICVRPGYSSHAMNYAHPFAQPGSDAGAIDLAIANLKARVESGLEQTKELVINYKFPNPIPTDDSKPQTPMPNVETRLNPLLNKHGLNPQQMPIAKPPFVRKPVISLDSIPGWLVKAVEQVLACKELPIQTVTNDIGKLLENYPVIKDTFNQTYCLEIQYLYRYFKNADTTAVGLHTLTTSVRDYCTLKAIQDFINPDEEAYTQDFKNSLTSKYGPLNNLSTIELGFNPNTGVMAEIKLRLLSDLPMSDTANLSDEKELIGQMISVLEKAAAGGSFLEEMGDIRSVFDHFYCDDLGRLNNFVLGIFYKYPAMKNYQLHDMGAALVFVCLTRLFGDKLTAIPKGYPVKLKVIYNSESNAINIYADHTDPMLCNITNLNGWFAVHEETSMLELLDYISSVPGIQRRLKFGVMFNIVPAKTRPFKLIPAYWVR